MKRLKLFSILFGTLLFCFCFASAQEPTCEGIDTIHWKRINTIPIDFGSKCIEVDYRKSYSIKPNIKIFTHLKRKKISGCNEYQSIDFKKYNIITFYSTVGSCKQPFVNYTLFNTGTKVPFLNITITQFGYCKNAVGVGFDCLVLKKLCPKYLKVCITRKIIEDKRFLEK